MDSSDSVILVKSVLTRLRKGFQENSNRSYEDRLRNLKALRTAITDMSNQICEAVEKDLNRNAFLTKVGETEGLKDKIDYYISNLRRFMKDKQRDILLSHGPGKNYVRQEPYGVALVIGS